jgi:hypothetical protein
MSQPTSPYPTGVPARRNWWEIKARRRLNARTDRQARGWADTTLLAGRTPTGLVVIVLLILVGSITDTTAFKSTLDLVLRESEAVSWLLAGGMTCLALAAAWTMGRKQAALRRLDPDTTGWQVFACAVVWLGLGLALFYVRWTSAASTQTSFSGIQVNTSHQAQQAHAAAVLFGALFLASGFAAAMEAARVTNPAYVAYRQAASALAAGQRQVAARAGMARRARLAVEHHAGEFDRDLARRDEACAERRALGAQAANYARVLIATSLQDPRKTGLTESGPVPPTGPDQDPPTGEVA